MITKVPLGVGNRDGDAWAVETADGRCFLVLGASSLMNPAVFPGMGSTEHVEISRAALAALVPVQEKASRQQVITEARAVQERCRLGLSEHGDPSKHGNEATLLVAATFLIDDSYYAIGKLIKALEE